LSASARRCVRAPSCRWRWRPIIEARLPVPIAISVYPAPLAEAALYGLLTALIFTLWPLARTEQVRAAALYRDASGPSRACPALGYLIVIALLARRSSASP
jgi:putative ABC transport system permease protein